MAVLRRCAVPCGCCPGGSPHSPCFANESRCYSEQVSAGSMAPSLRKWHKSIYVRSMPPNNAAQEREVRKERECFWILVHPNFCFLLLILLPIGVSCCKEGKDPTALNKDTCPHRVHIECIRILAANSYIFLFFVLRIYLKLSIFKENTSKSLNLMDFFQ